MFGSRSVLFWPIGTGDSTTFVVREDEIIFQVDLRHTAKSEDEETDCAPIIDHLEENLPKVDGKPYLSAFALTHPDEDHILGFAELLDRVTIGELWFTPRVFREHDDDEDGMCDDAKAFREEAHRRVTATIEAGGDPGSGDRVRLIGYDTLLEEDHYQGFPTEFFSVPGHVVTTLDGEKFEGEFRVFIHAPFKQDDSVGDRNDTSLVMQVVLGDDPAEGGVLLFGDHKYPTIRKIFDVSKENDNEENLEWQILLAPHHCSKSVMYQDEDGEEVLKKDILDDFEGLQVGDGIVVSSSLSVPNSNSSGDNPPHAKAKARYEEIAGGGFLCTHGDGGHAKPLQFILEDKKFVLDNSSSEDQSDSRHGKSALAAAVETARGSDETPSEKVGFGQCS
ncbi:MAG: hypothetical protein J5I92_15250 [Thiogranum sp.]|nr:hypothetical protein [Thiogranum sp.]